MRSCIFVGKRGGKRKITEWPFYFFNKADKHAEYEK